MRLLISVALLAGVWPNLVVAQGSCGFLLKSTQAFSDAGQRGDGVAMGKLLDPDVIFFNEAGDKATRADMAGAAPPSTVTPVRIIKTTDWDCKDYGNVAVTSFIDVLDPGGQSEIRFRSVETWRKADGAWRMIGSETLTMAQDPDVVTLAASQLDEYAGSYEAEAGMRFKFARKGSDLLASLNGGAETAQKAQARDIFFTPGHGATPKVFLRGDDGKINRFIYLRGKSSIVFKRAVQ